MMDSRLMSDELATGVVSQDDAADAVIYARRLLMVVALLCCFGLTMLYSTSYNAAGAEYFRKQLMWIVAGGAGAFAVFVIGYRRIASWSTVWLVLSIVLLLLALKFKAINGANRWIRIGGFSIQPSEFAKIAMAIYTARYVSDNLRTFGDLMRKRGGLIEFGLVAGLLLGCIILGRDLGTTTLVATMVFVTLLAGGLRLRYLIIPVALASLVATYIWFFDKMRMGRVTSFMEPETYAKTTGYQLYNSLLALGSGNWFGIGFMESRLKARYLPEAHTDFILSIVGEELGLVVLALLVVCYGIFTWYALKISVSANSRLGMLLGFALTAGISLQAVINIAVISGAAPTKGMPAPFISYGGSNLMAGLLAIGLLLSIAAETAHPGYNEEYLSAIRRKLPFLFRNRNKHH
ncbi:MAG: FtsW/RodA/SpoVE family cell cycle protein [Victivallaceae bacterium]